jgi:polyphenol oxidase
MLRAHLLEATGLARAGFTTRQGGVSEGPAGSLNLSYAVGDRPAAVTENRRRAAAALPADPRRLVEAQQVHGPDAAVVDGRHAGRMLSGVDALVTRSSGIWLAIHTADCVPILLLDPAGPGAAAVHAGWRGVAAGVVPAAVRALERAAGAVPAGCLAAIGPAIGGCCYEVDAPVAEAMGKASWWPEAASPAGPGKWYLDLRRAVRAQLLAAGLRPEHIEVVPGCTRCQPDVFFSYRREQKTVVAEIEGTASRTRSNDPRAAAAAATGRMAACIRLCERAQRE